MGRVGFWLTLIIIVSALTGIIVYKELALDQTAKLLPAKTPPPKRVIRAATPDPVIDSAALPEPRDTPRQPVVGYHSDWEKVYGGRRSDYFSQVAVSESGDLIMAGRTESKGAGAGDIWLMHTNAAGKPLWDHTYGGKAYEELYHLLPLPRNHMLLVGTTESVGQGKADGWVFEVNGKGKIVWQKTYGGKNQDFLRYALRLGKGGYLLVGGTKSSKSRTIDGWLIKTNRRGSIRWQRTYGGAQFMHFNHALPLAGNQVLLIGQGQEKVSHGLDGLIVQIDGKGQVVNKVYVGEREEENFQFGLQLDNGDFLLAGYTESKGSGQTDGWLVRLNNQGRAVWEKTYGGASRDALRQIIALEEDRWLLVGDTGSRKSKSNDGWLLIVDGEGSVIWEDQFGGNGADWFRYAHAADGLVLVGSKHDRTNHAWLVHMAPSR